MGNDERRRPKTGQNANIDPNASRAEPQAAADDMFERMPAQGRPKAWKRGRHGEISPEQEAIAPKIEGRGPARANCCARWLDLGTIAPSGPSGRSPILARVYASKRFGWRPFLSVLDNLRPRLAALPMKNPLPPSDAGNNLSAA